MERLQQLRADRLLRAVSAAWRRHARRRAASRRSGAALLHRFETRKREAIFEALRARARTQLVTRVFLAYKEYNWTSAVLSEWHETAHEQRGERIADELWSRRMGLRIVRALHSLAQTTKRGRAKVVGHFRETSFAIGLITHCFGLWCAPATPPPSRATRPSRAPHPPLRGPFIQALRGRCDARPRA